MHIADIQNRDELLIGQVLEHGHLRQDVRGHEGRSGSQYIAALVFIKRENAVELSDPPR